MKTYNTVNEHYIQIEEDSLRPDDVSPLCRINEL